MPTPILKADASGTYYAHWSENRRSKRKSMGTRNRVDAETLFGQWLALGGHRQKAVGGGPVSLTVSELWTVYDKKHVQKNSAAPAAIGYCWKNLKSHFGSVVPSDIEQTIVDDYEDLRAEGSIGKPAKPSTVRKELAALRACINWHASPERGRMRLLDPKDVPAFSLPEESGPRERWLTTDEVKAVLKAARELHPGANRMTRGERFLWLALETAARKQAILDLTWDRVDFETRMIHYADPVRKQTKKRRPSVPISDTLMPILILARDEATEDLVLDHGGAIWSTIQATVIKAGLAPKQTRKSGETIKGTGISPHTFRHTAATHMARRGVPLYDIAGVLGNTLAMVEKVYAKHCPGRLRDAVNSISSS